MEAHAVPRRLTVILHADVQGYSRRIEHDDVATLRVLTPSLQMMHELVRQHGGHPIGSRGDSLLAEFPSVRSAVQCAVEMQRELRERNAAVPTEQRIEFRMGIHAGEVVEDDAQLHGDGINIAVRIEGLAEAGGIYLSGSVYDQVKNKLPLQYEDLGHQQLKNIAEPVRVYRVVLEGQRLTASKRGKRFLSPHPGKRPWVKAIGAGIVVLLLVAGISALWYQFASLPHAPSSTTPQQSDKTLPLPDKPSIVVLPFVNMSGDPAQEYFSDGMTETLITDLSKISGLFVIARNSAFTYKGKAVKVDQVGRELGVQHVLEGSVQRAGERVRINAQLVDATTGGHVWAERYDRELKDIFTLQDEITQKIAFALKVKLTQEEQERFRRAPTDNLEAYDSFLRGLTYHVRYTKDGSAQARQLYEQALELDPQYAGAYALLGHTYFLDWITGWSPDPQNPERALKFVQKAIVLNDSLAIAHGVLGQLYLWKNRQHDQALAEAELAIALAPNDADAYVWLAWILLHAGKPEEAIEALEKAMRLDPHYPVHCLIFLGEAYYWLGQYEEAIAAEKKALLRNPDDLGAHVRLAVFYAELGREKEAQVAIAEILRLSPNYSLEVVKLAPYKDPTDLERILAALRKAGLQ